MKYGGVFAIAILIIFNTHCMEEVPVFSEEFFAIQKIHELAKQCTKHFQPNGVNVFSLKENRPQPYSTDCQTKQGLYLSIDIFPTHLGTPYGEIELFNGFSYINDKNIQFIATFIKHMELRFIKNTGEDNQITQFYAQKNMTIPFYTYSNTGDKETISKEQLESYRGSNTLITSLPGCASLYEIISVKQTSIPPLLFYENTSNLKPLEVLRREYMLLKEQYVKQYTTKNILTPSFSIFHETFIEPNM